MTQQLTEQQATAAGSGASATEVFRQKAKAGFAVPKERVDTLATEVLTAIHDVIRRHQVSYPEYDALKSWLIQVGADGEWPLFLDVFVEHVVEEVANASREGSKGTIEGPYYVPGAPALGSEGTLPMREDEPGTPLVFRATVTDVSGKPLSGATVDLWQADDLGFYSQFAPGLPEWNLRGTFTTDDEGRFTARTVRPAPYQIPHDGATGKLIEAAGWHAWRPAHLHLKVTAPAHQSLTTQLYFANGDYVDSDIASAVKPELVITSEPGECSYEFVLDPA